MENPINLVNETELTDWFKKITWTIGENVNVTAADFKNRDFVRDNPRVIAQFLTHAYIKRGIRAHISKYAGDEFLVPVRDIENQTEPIMTSIQAGSKVYKFHADRVPEKLASEIQKLNKNLFSVAMDYVNQQVSDSAAENFSIDMRHLNKKFPDFESALAHRTHIFAKGATELTPPPRSDNANIFTGPERD